MKSGGMHGVWYNKLNGRKVEIRWLVRAMDLVLHTPLISVVV